MRHVVTPLHDVSGLTELFSGCSAVVHAAGGGMTVRPEEMAERNLHTTQGVVAAALAAEVPRFVLVSSMAAGGPRAEAHLPAPERPLSLYGKAKLDAEAVVRQHASEIEVVVLRPPGVTGAGDDRMLPMFRAAARGVVPVPRPARSSSFIHVDDCARALALLCDASLPSPVVYELDDGGPHDWQDIVGVLGRAVGRPTRMVRVPMTALRVVGLVSEMWSRVRNQPTVVHRDKVQDMQGIHWVSDGSSLTADTGWTPRMGLERSMTEMAADYRARGLL